MYMTDERPVGVPADELAVHVHLDGAGLDRKLTALRAMATQTSGLIAMLDPGVVRRSGRRGGVRRRSVPVTESVVPPRQHVAMDVRGRGPVMTVGLVGVVGRERIRSVAAAAGGRVDRDPGHVAAVDADRRQGAHGLDAADEPLVERAAVRLGAGLTTSLIPHGDRAFQIDLDLVAHRLDISVTDGATASMALAPRTVADFFAELMGHLDPLGSVHADLDDAGGDPRRHPLRGGHQHDTYDPEQAHRFWLALVQMDRVFEVFRSRFVGKVSPVHLFWGALDLAVTRFSGRTAPPHPGGAPNCGPHVMHEAYSHEVSSAGYWPGPDGEGVFYSYAYPAPDGFADARARRARRPLRRSARRVHASVRGGAHRRRPGRAPADVPPGHLRGRGRPGRWDRAALERHA